MSDLKTKENDASVEAFLNGVEHDVRRADAFTLLEIMTPLTGEPAKMWGKSIVGFGRYHYKYKSGREGDWMLTGFSPRKASMSVYIMSGFKEEQDLLSKLGKHKHSVSCLYINKLPDIDQVILEELISRSLVKMRKWYDA